MEKDKIRKEKRSKEENEERNKIKKITSFKIDSNIEFINSKKEEEKPIEEKKDSNELKISKKLKDIYKIQK